MTRLNIPLFVALAASILSAVPVDARDTLPHQRMVRKRGPPVVGGPGPIGAAAVIGLHVRQVSVDPTGSISQTASSAPASTTAATASTTREATTSSTAAAATTTSVATSSRSSAAVTTTTSPSSSTSATQASTSSGGLLDSLTGILGSSTSATSSPASSTLVTSSTPVSTSTTPVAAPSTTQAQQPAEEVTPTLNIATPPPTATARSPSVSVNVITSTRSLTPEASASQAAKEKTQKITRNTIVSLVVIASCIGGAIAIWTVIRKWKLSPSEKFDDRMQPIDWAPPPANGAAEDAIEEKSKHRRAGSGASHGSFTSGGVGQSEQGHGAKYADSQYGHGYGPQSQDLPPPHDFTAGTAQPGGYGQYYGGQYAGGPGYADLQRGPSLSESNYSHGANVSRGMSYSRGHGAYDSQSSAVPHMPNPYGGEYAYEDYNHPPAAQQPQGQAQGQAPYRAF